jgi:hypothetical protein
MTEQGIHGCLTWDVAQRLQRDMGPTMAPFHFQLTSGGPIYGCRSHAAAQVSGRAIERSRRRLYSIASSSCSQLLGACLSQHTAQSPLPHISA